MDAGERAGLAHRYAAGIAAWDLEGLLQMRHRDYVARWPQSGELVRGRERIGAVERGYPGGAPTLGAIRRVSGRDDLWTVEASTVYPDGSRWSWVSILRLQDERVVEETEYFCEPLPAPAWRAPNVTRFEGTTPPLELPPAPELSAAALAHLSARYEAAEQQRDFAVLATLRGGEWCAEWPQTGERVPSHAADVAIHSSYPGYPDLRITRVASSPEGWELTPLLTPIRVHGIGPLIVFEGVNDYANGERWLTVVLAETGDGRVRRETAYFGRPFDAPAWRRDLVETFDPLLPR
jgi:hypothetical protein